MKSLTVRVSRPAHAILRSLAEETNESMTDVLEKAIEPILPPCALMVPAGKKSSPSARIGTPHFLTASRIDGRWRVRHRLAAKSGTRI